MMNSTASSPKVSYSGTQTMSMRFKACGEEPSNHTTGRLMDIYNVLCMQWEGGKYVVLKEGVSLPIPIL